MVEKEIYDLVNLGMVIDFDGDEGMICHKRIMDNKVYVNIAFDEEGGSVNYKVFEVKPEGDNVRFSEVEDENIKGKLTAYWVAEDIEESKES